jgi:transmembrane 9 superfamily protein 3
MTFYSIISLLISHRLCPHLSPPLSASLTASLRISHRLSPQFYYVYGFLLLVASILMMVTICTSIVAAYFVLNAENYHWQWVAMGAAGSTSGYVFLYSIFYFCFKTQMTGLLQVAFYFGYTALFCSALFLMCGTVGVWGTSVFVNKIYKSIKID